MNGFRFNDKHLSQIPALQLLINIDFEYLSPSKALAARQGIDLLEKQAEAFRKQKRGLMQKLLTGKWRIMEGMNKHRQCTD